VLGSRQNKGKRKDKKHFPSLPNARTPVSNFILMRARAACFMTIARMHSIRQKIIEKDELCNNSLSNPAQNYKELT
jgi:hypothetical protein